MLKHDEKKFQISETAVRLDVSTVETILPLLEGNLRPKRILGKLGLLLTTLVAWGLAASQVQAVNLFVSSSGVVKEYNGTTGAFINNFTSPVGGLNQPIGLTFGPNGNLFVSSRNTNDVKEYDGTTGAFINNFTSPVGGLNHPRGLTFGPNGNLFVSSAGTNEVQEYNGTTGAFITSFVTPVGGLNDPEGLTFGPNGNLFVSSADTDEVQEYNGTTGAFITSFVTPGSGGLSLPTFLTFGDDYLPTSVPEPSPTLGLFTFGVLLGSAGLKRQWKRNKQDC